MQYLVKRRFDMIADSTFNERRSWWTCAVILPVAVALSCLPARGNPPMDIVEECG